MPPTLQSALLLDATPQSALLIEALSKSIHTIGYDKTITNIKTGLIRDTVVDKSISEKVLTAVVAAFTDAAFGVTANEILHGTGRKNERQHAIGFCAYYLHYVYNYEMPVVATMLNKKDVSLCYKTSKVIKNLKENHPTEQKYIEIKGKLDIVLTP